MSKHTPGPWQIIKFPEAVIIACNPKIDRCATICELPMPSTDEEAEEIEANTRLIAAAPEMLDLLKKIADWPFPFLSGKGIDEVRELAGEMVKKVEGEV